MRPSAAPVEHDEIVLWFEHDLYDQLQLVQVLDGLSALRGPPISLVCEAEYLGKWRPERAAELFTRDPPHAPAFPGGAVRLGGVPLLRSPANRSVQAEGAAIPGRGAAPAPGRISVDDRWPVAQPAANPRSTEGWSAAVARPLPQVDEEPAFLGDTMLALVCGANETRWLPRWLGGYRVKDGTVRWDPALSRLIRT